jgi:hypothetical protein
LLPAWAIALDVIVACLLALLLIALWLIVRRRWLTRHGGTFELSVRLRPAKVGRSWVLGLGRYSGGDLEWFRIFSLSPRPLKVLRRSELSVVSRRPAQGSEEFALYDDAVVVECRYAGQPLDLALTTSALTGLMAWLEAAPPGRDLLTS